MKELHMTRIAMESPRGTNLEGLYMPTPRARGAAYDARPSWDRRRARDEGENDPGLRQNAWNRRQGDRRQTRDEDGAVQLALERLSDFLSEAIEDDEKRSEAQELANGIVSACRRDADGEEDDKALERNQEQQLSNSGGAMDRGSSGMGLDSGAAFRRSGRVSGERSMLARMFPRSKNPVNGWAGR